MECVAQAFVEGVRWQGDTIWCCVVVVEIVVIVGDEENWGGSEADAVDGGDLIVADDFERLFIGGPEHGQARIKMRHRLFDEGPENRRGGMRLPATHEWEVEIDVVTVRDDEVGLLGEHAIE